MPAYTQQKTQQQQKKKMTSDERYRANLAMWTPAAFAARRAAMELRELEALADALFAGVPKAAHAANFGEDVVVSRKLHYRRDALALAMEEHAEEKAEEEERREAERAAVAAVETRRAAKAAKLAALRAQADEAKRAAVAAKLAAVLEAKKEEKRETQRVRIELGADAAPVKKQAGKMLKGVKPVAFKLVK